MTARALDFSSPAAGDRVILRTAGSGAGCGGRIVTRGLVGRLRSRSNLPGHVSGPIDSRSGLIAAELQHCRMARQPQQSVGASAAVPPRPGGNAESQAHMRITRSGVAADMWPREAGATHLTPYAPRRRQTTEPAPIDRLRRSQDDQVTQSRGARQADRCGRRRPGPAIPLQRSRWARGSTLRPPRRALRVHRR